MINNKYRATDHTFVICAYGESKYLEDCIRSLFAQSVRTTIKMVTSTPNTHIQKIAEKYGIPLVINAGKAGLAGDWNFAIANADTKLVTLAHQDDIYLKTYAEKVIKNCNRCKHPIIACTNYCELREEKIVRNNKVLNIKRIMMLPLIFRPSWSVKWIRRSILAFGSAICCPSVTIIKDNICMPLFEDNMRSNIDWQAWEKLSRQRGEFIYCSSPLMLHRIHEASTTSAVLGDGARSDEDLFMFEKFWPEQFAKVITKIYRAGEKSNNLK